MKLVIRTPDELIAAIPHLLGFQPDESIVFMPMRSDLPIARADLPITPDDRAAMWASLSDGLSRHVRAGASFSIVCVTDDCNAADMVSQEFAVRLDSIGIDTQMRLWASDSHWSDLDSGESGLLTQAARDRITVMTIAAGRTQPAVSRDSFAASLIGDREPVAKLLPHAHASARQSTPRTETRWALDRLEQFHADGHRLGDSDAARLLVAADSISIRDRLLADLTRDNVDSHVTLWTDMTKRAPDDVRAAPASMLAFASWLYGDGAMAWCALDQVPQDRPYPLAELLAVAVQTGIHPQEWDAVMSQHPHLGTDLGPDLTAQQRGTQPGPARPEHEM
ncbi:DUF4192 domain-containing protein [Jiangella alba]|uniref:DUF4192 domain-containing protein n=1 Tax=Jiangella alba TaxID=561176 RepID=A0A1H5J534_9ACTN|nr:DUF4192 domain-containing protein [Jiangella alba]SEE47540.1 protein of unknown function [Jiangella alba]